MIYQGKASHIVGGEIQYKYLGGNKYHLTFKIYRDCSSNTKFDGDNTSNFSSKFYFGIFEGNVDNNIFSESNRGLALKSKKTILPVIVHYCLQANNSCVEEGIYETIIDLPKNDIGYTIIHQRCCRNDDILNIKPMPGGNNTMPGFTIKCFIPPVATFANNSPIFKNFPPIFICRDQSFYFDHGATDADGDSLRYFLSEPFDGLTESMPLSSDQSIAGMKRIEWETGYSMTNMLGGNPALTIDSSTGFLSCRPNKNGRFVVSIIVVEYRNGVPIDTINRDFQFNVVDCDIPKADMPFQHGTMNPNTGIGAYLYTFCDTFFVKFKNTSSNSSIYKWDFGDPLSGANNYSHDFEPTHTYTDTGIFIVKLIAYKVKTAGDTCIDSTYRYVRVYPKFKVLFIGHNACPDSPVVFQDLTSSHYGVTQKWRWNFGDGNTSTEQHPKHVYGLGGNYKVTLIAKDSKLCIDDTSMTITIHQKPIFPDSLPLRCLGVEDTIESSVLIYFPDSIVSKRWTIFNNESTSPRLIYKPISDTPVSIKLIVRTDKGCKFEKTYLQKVFPKPSPPVLQDSYFIQCKDSLLCGIADPYALRYKWHDGTKDSVRFLSQKGFYKLTITYPCENFVDSFHLFGNLLKADFNFIDKCESDTYFFENKSSTWLTTSLKFRWHVGNIIDTNMNFKYKFSYTNCMPVKLIIHDEFNCQDSITKQPVVFPLPKFVFTPKKVCKDVPTRISALINLPTPYRILKWEWKQDGQKISTDSFYIYTSKSYQDSKFSLILETDKGCLDSANNLIETHPLPNPKKLKDSFFIHCADNLKIDVRDSLAISYSWQDKINEPVRFIDYPGKFYYTINYPCMLHSDSIKIHNSCTIEVPKAFTPNGDGNNDILFIRGYKVKKLISFKIYNRQGQLLYYSTNPDEGWDGYYKGQIQNSETYYYTYEAETHKNGGLISGDGQFLLLR
jgi:gliding motility-associated-like protein